MAKTNVFKVLTAYGICYCCLKKVIKKNISRNGYFLIIDCQIYFKIDRVQDINDINKLC